MLGDACNVARYFISTNFTLPHIRRLHGSGLFDRSNSRLVHSGLCQFFPTFSPYTVIDPRPITRGHLWLAFTLSFLGDRASVYSRLQRAVSVPEIALRFFQRSIRGSVSGRYPIIPLLGVPVRENSVFPVAFTSSQAYAQLKFVCEQRVAAQWNSS